MSQSPSAALRQGKLHGTKKDSNSDISLSAFGSLNSSFSSLSNTSQITSNSKVDLKLTKSKSGIGSKQSLGESEDSNRISNGKSTYQMGAEIGRGGFAIVYSAFNVETGDFVAVKRFPLDAIDGDSLSKIQDEIELMKQLNHPNIVKYFNTIKSKSHLHIVLEYMENGSLSTVIKKYGSISELLTASYVTQVLQGLKYLHDQGVLHRDIKGANILTTKEGTVKLADFGVAMKLSDAHADDQDVVGSPYWIAPEIIEMSTPTAACDIWSVGCIIIELLTGKPPYYDLPPMAALFRIVQDDYPPFPEGISQALRDFLLLCFQKEPVMRSSAAKLLEHPWLSNFSKGSNLNRRNQTNYDEDSASAQNESVDKSLDSFASPLTRSRSTNLTSRSSISSTVKATTSLSTSSDLVALLSSSHSKGSSPRNRKGPGHNRSSGKKRDARTVFHGVNLPTENESFGTTTTRTEVEQLSSFNADDTITLDRYHKQIKPQVGYSDMSDCTPSSLNRSVDDVVNAKISLSRPSSPALSDSTTDTKDMMLPAPGMMHVSVNSGFTADIALGQVHINSAASSLSTPTSISNPTSKVNSGDHMDDNSNIRFPSSDSMESIGFQAGKDVIVDEGKSLHPELDSDEEGDCEDWDITGDDSTGVFSAGDAAQSLQQLFKSNNPSSNLEKNLENMSAKSKLPEEKLSLSDSSKKKFYSSDKSSSGSTGLLANLIDISFSKKNLSNTSSSRDLAELNISNKPILNVNNSSFLLSKYQETADDINFDDLFDGSEANHSQDVPSQKIISGLSKSSDYTYQHKNERVLRSKSSDYYESSPTQNRRPLYRNDVHKSKIGIAVVALSNSSDRSTALSDVLPVGPTRWNELELSQSADHFSEKQQDPQHVIKHPFFKRLGMISEDKDSNDYDFNNDFEIDPSIDFNERLERYRNNTVTGSSSSSSSSGGISGSSRDRGRGLYHPKRLDITSFSTNSAADVDYDSDGHDDDNFAGKLRERLQSKKDAEFDSFNNYQFFDEKDFKQDESKDEHFRRSREVVEIMEKIRPDTMEEVVIDLCNKLMDLFNRYPDQRDHLITYHGVMPIIDMFEARTSAESKSQGGKILRPYVLQVINKIIEGSTRAQEQISLVGLIPTIMNLFEKSCRVHEQSNYLSMSFSIYGSNSVDRMLPGSQDYTPNKYSSSIIQSPYAQWQGEVNPVAIEAARFIHQISSTSQLTLQMLIGAGGLSVLTTMVSFGAYIVPKGLVSAPVSVTHSLSHSRSSSHSHIMSHSLSPPAPNLTPTATAYKGTLSLGLSAESEGIASVHRANYSQANLATMSLKSSRSPMNTYSVKYDPRLVRSFSPSGAVDVDPNNSNDVQSVTAGVDASEASGTQQNLPDADTLRQALSMGDPKNCLDIFRMGIDCITQVFSVQSSRTRDFCRLFVKLGLLQHLAVSFQNILFLFLTLMNKRGHLRSFSGSSVLNFFNLASESSQNEGSNSKAEPLEQIYAKYVATLFLKFSRSDAVVAQIMANSEAGVIATILAALSAPELRNQISPANRLHHPASPLTSQQQQQFSVKVNSSNNITGLLHSTENINSNNNNSKIRHAANIGGLHPAYLEIVELLLKCCKNLSMEPSILNELDKAGIIETLIPLLQGPVSELCKNHVLPCLFNMCRINKKRQEKAARLGLIPHLKKVVADRSHLKQFALPIIFDLAHASNATRAELWKNDGVAFYLDQLKENYWHTSALNSLSTWLAREMPAVSRLLIEPAKLSKLIDFFRSSNSTVHKNLKPLVDMMKSPELSQSLGSSSVFVSVLSKRLTSTKDAFVSRSLLRMLDAIIGSLPDPKLWIAQHNLYSVLSEVSQTDQILVNKSAKDLLQSVQGFVLPPQKPPQQQHHPHHQT